MLNPIPLAIGRLQCALGNCMPHTSLTRAVSHGQSLATCRAQCLDGQRAAASEHFRRRRPGSDQPDPIVGNHWHAVPRCQRAGSFAPVLSAALLFSEPPPQISQRHLHLVTNAGTEFVLCSSDGDPQLSFPVGSHQIASTAVASEVRRGGNKDIPVLLHIQSTATAKA